MTSRETIPHYENDKVKDNTACSTFKNEQFNTLLYQLGHNLTLSYHSKEKGIANSLGVHKKHMYELFSIHAYFS